MLQILLEVVHDLFEEQTSVAKMVSKLMKRAQSLLKCDRCVVKLKDTQYKDAGGGGGPSYSVRARSRRDCRLKPHRSISGTFCCDTVMVCVDIGPVPISRPGLDQ